MTATERLEIAVADLRVMVARIDAQIPDLTTKADLAEKPGKAYIGQRHLNVSVSRRSEADGRRTRG